MTTSSVLMAATASGAMAASSQAKKSWPIASRDAHLSVTKAPDVWTAMKQVGVTGVEVEVNDKLECPALFHPTQKYAIDSPKAIAKLKEDLQANGLQITSFLTHNHFDERTDFELEWCAKIVDAAKKLDVPAIRIDVVPRKIKERDEFVQFAIGVGKKLVAMVEDSNVRFGIENHGSTTNDPEFLNALFGAVGSKKLGLTLDTGNFYWFGHPLSKLYDIFETFAPYACHTHCKSIKYPEDKKNSQRKMGWEYGKYCCPIYAGDVDFEKVVSILAKAGYNGDLCVEDESLGKFPEAERADVLKKEAEFLKKFV